MWCTRCPLELPKRPLPSSLPPLMQRRALCVSLPPGSWMPGCGTRCRSTRRTGSWCGGSKLASPEPAPVDGFRCCALEPGVSPVPSPRRLKSLAHCMPGGRPGGWAQHAGACLGCPELYRSQPPAVGFQTPANRIRSVLGERDLVSPGAWGSVSRARLCLVFRRRAQLVAWPRDNGLFVLCPSVRPSARVTQQLNPWEGGERHPLFYRWRNRGTEWGG